MGMSRHPLILIVLVFLGCSEATIQQGNAVGVRRPDVVRIHVPNAGISKLFDLASPDGFELEIPARKYSLGSAEVTIGPSIQTVAVSSRTANSGSQVQLRTRFQSLSLFLPVRVKRGVDVEICRFRFRTPQLDIQTPIGLDGLLERPTLGLAGEVDVQSEDTEWTLSSPCSIGLGAELDGGLNVEEALQQAIFEGFEQSASDAIRVAPLDLMGVPEAPQHVTRSSPYDGRRGAFRADLRTSLDGVELSNQGLNVRLDLGLEPQRARCVPPIAPPVVDPVTPGPLNPLEISGSGSDFALLLSRSVLQSLANQIVLSGFLCRGLDDTRSPEEAANTVATESLLLENIGLGQIQWGPFMTLTSRPGGLPTLTHDAQSGLLQIDWEDFGIEIYGQLHGARVRVLELRTAASVRLRPVANTTQVVRMSVESMAVQSASITSMWTQDSEDEALKMWARRTLILALEDSFVFPVPLMTPGLRVVDVNIRENDAVLLLRFD